MEYNNSEMSGCSSNSDGGSFINHDTEFSNNEPKQESMRFSVAKKLYPLCSTTEYHNMPINEINKCIDKFHKKNPSFPETVRSIINNTSNVCETQETNKSARTLIKEDYDDNESQHSEIEKHSK
ncbi:hypothetical protein C1646_776330 [Rhizophagus diaphanus]|nr:hypothetical protein C1646_776330 [Rhizophagus diaphanus] [Rhizophagus sp. MUCL 43196]